MKLIKISNGMEIPQIGLGMWQITDRETVRDVIGEAVRIGYRMFDTAAAYSNEIAIGKALQEQPVPRHEIFLTDKVWNTCRGYDKVQEACKRSLKKLKTDYIDLYLIHWPASMKLYPDWAEVNADTWRGMEALCRDGLVRAIGVCNFKVHHLEELKRTAELMPMVNQFEFHPGMTQEEVFGFCRREQIAVMASSPLGNGRILGNEKLTELARKMKKSAAQICLRWAVQKGAAVIPKTVSGRRLQENYDIFGFELSAEEMRMIDDIPYCGGIGIDSDEVVEFE